MGIMGINPDRMSLINYLGVSEPVGTWCIDPTGLAMLKFRSAGNINKKRQVSYYQTTASAACSTKLLYQF